MAKFSDDSGWARAFRTWRYPLWFRAGVGVTETVSSVLLLSRRTATAGAALIIIVMTGAMATHIRWGRPGQITSEILPLVLATCVAIGRRHTLLLRRSARRGRERG